MSETTFDLGPYTVRLGLRRDNPAFPVHLVFRGDKLIGKQFSRPNLDDCKALERERAEERRLTPRPVWLAEPFESGKGFRAPVGGAHRRRGPGRPRKDAPRESLKDLAEVE